MKLVIVLLGVLLIVVGVVRESRILYSDFVAAGLLIFCLGGASYFVTWPVSRNEEQKWRFNPEFVWFSIYLVVLVTSVYWLRLLLRR